MNPAITAQAPRLRGKLILGGLLLYVLFLILQMPAAWLIARLSADSPIQLGQASGFPWQGAVPQVTWRVDNDRLELGGLAWYWMPGELLNARMGFTFELGQAPNKLKGIFLLGRDGTHLRTVQGKLDAAILGFASRPLSLLHPQGSLAIDIPDLHLGEKRIHGEASLYWQGARSSLVAAPLGDYHVGLRAAPDGRIARINMHTQQGALTINGNGDYTPGKGVTGKLLLTPPGDERRKLYTPVLDLFGRPDASGTWVLNLAPQ